MTVRSPLKWIGGKSAAAERIVTAFPLPHLYDTYVDVCGGAANVLLARPSSWNHHEVYNDLDDNLVTFWREVQENAETLQTYLNTLPYARSLYYEFYRSLFNGTPLSSFERAARWFYCLRATGTGWLRKSPVGWDSRGSNVQAFRSVLEMFIAVQERFHFVAIDNRDVLATITRFDGPRTLFYIDPPYFGAEQYYEASKHGFPHAALANLLQLVKGYVSLSYYPHPDIERWYAGWRRMTWQQHKSSQIQIPDRKDTATEMLLCNYTDQHSLWDREGGSE